MPTEELAEQGKLPFYFIGGKVGCLLVHGFSGSPSEMRQLGEFLANAGYTVAGVRLAGHGKTHEVMAKTRWTDWYRSVEKGYWKLRETCDTIFAIGLSMGGALCLYGATRLNFAGVVSICAPIYLADRKAYLAPAFQHLIKFYRKKSSTKDQALNQETGRFTNQLIPMAALVSLLKLIKEVKGKLPGVKLPVLVIQSKKDGVVLPKSGHYIYKHLGASDKELVWLEKSGHLATIDSEQDVVFKLVEEFLNLRQ
ncbi:MAG: alpha/beta fold hydrolase [Clostridia bacterium]|jgi:carboxylesterase|nr:alpha/beta fold hydrolase [Clostridia bacterium]